jgi:hypothetical protein
MDAFEVAENIGMEPQIAQMTQMGKSICVICEICGSVSSPRCVAEGFVKNFVVNGRL